MYICFAVTQQNENQQGHFIHPPLYLVSQWGYELSCTSLSYVLIDNIGTNHFLIPFQYYNTSINRAVACNKSQSRFFFRFYDYFAEMQNRSLVSEREFTHLVGWSVGRSLGRKLLFAFPLINAQLDLTKRKLSSNGSANVKHS